MNLQFENGDSIACIGDSNTSAEITQISYSQFLQYLYMTRFPKRNVRFINCGIAGDSYPSAMKRLDWDIMLHTPTKAIVHLGTNDICYQTYPRLDNEGNDSGTDHLKIQEIFTNCRAMADTLLQNGIQPTLVLPGGFYECSDHPRSETFRGANKALQELSGLIRKHYAGSDIPVIDLFPAFEHMRRTVPASEITPDRVHFHTMMHLLIAAVIAEAQGFDENISSVHIGSLMESYRCDVKNVSVGSDIVTFTYAPHSLPFYESSVYRQLEQYYPLSLHLNQELLYVDNLTSGQYQLILDGTDAGRYSAEKLASGINIAGLKENPNLEPAKKLYKLLCDDWYRPMHDLRRLAYQTEHCLELGIDIKQIPEYDPQDKQGVEPAFLNFAGGFYATIIGLFQNQQANRDRLEELWQQASASAQPNAYTVIIRKNN